MRKLVKVECSKCGHVSWWAKENTYHCRKCGSKDGNIINLPHEALKERRLETQRRLLGAR